MLKQLKFNVILLFINTIYIVQRIYLHKNKFLIEFKNVDFYVFRTGGLVGGDVINFIEGEGSNALSIPTFNILSNV